MTIFEGDKAISEISQSLGHSTVEVYGHRNTASRVIWNLKGLSVTNAHVIPISVAAISYVLYNQVVPYNQEDRLSPEIAL